MSARHSKPHPHPSKRALAPLVDRAGRAPRGHVRGGEERVVVAYAKAKYVTAWQPSGMYRRLQHRALIQFEGAPKDEWVEARHVYVRDRDDEDAEPIALTRALSTMSHHAWWMNASRGLERRATIYEERMGDEFVPHPGWTLVSSDAVLALVAHSKETTSLVLSNAETLTESEYKRKERLRSYARALDEAKATLNKHVLGVERKRRLVEKWVARVRELEGRVKGGGSPR